MTEQKIPIPRLTAFESYAANQIATRNEIAGPQLAEEEIKRILTKADKILNCYFKIEFFDIYLASSLRNFKDFEKTERVLKEIETAMPGIKI
ncbi:hypothetical protein KKB69_02535, partial [Patescibacteria group bacterium]|nr:hypothetical protein [Patescibacteria group bacterium]